MGNITASAPIAINTKRSRALPRYAAVVLAYMVLVILWGAVVRATGSGAGCGNHWPLCNGDFFPSHPRLATVIEFTHRSMTGICTALVAGLVAWTFFACQKGHRARRAAVWSAILLVTEAFLGAVLVKGGYVEANASTMRIVMQCVHFTNTMLLLAALTITWWWLQNRDQPRTFPSHTRTIAWLALISTLVVGATGSVAALADTLFPSPSLQAGLLQDFSASAPMIVRMRWLHPAAAIFGLAAAVLLARVLRGAFGRTLLLLIAAQIVLGIGDVVLLAPTWMQMLHLLGADLYWIALSAACATVLAPSASTVFASTGRVTAAGRV
jgi:cytochrome c oxidase assembly protein subunit 15